MAIAWKKSWSVVTEKFMTFRLSDYRDLATLIFYATLILIFFQKLSFLFDKHFFYEVGEHMPNYGNSLTLTMNLFFDLATMPSIRIFLISAELLLLLRCIVRKPDLTNFFTLLGFSFINYQSSYYLQEGGMNISLFGLFAATLYVLSVSDFIKSPFRKDQIFRAYVLLVRLLVLLYIFTKMVGTIQDFFWHGADAGFGLYLALLIQLAFPLMVFFRSTRNTILSLTIVLQVLMSSELNLWLYTGSIIIFFLSFLRAEEAQAFRRRLARILTCPAFPMPGFMKIQAGIEVEKGESL
jgi:hypothetical protein